MTILSGEILKAGVKDQITIGDQNLMFLDCTNRKQTVNSLETKISQTILLEIVKSQMKVIVKEKTAN